MDSLDRDIINHLQGGFPICDEPYRQAAEQLDCDEQTLIERVQSMLDRGILSRFGPLFNIERSGGAFTLCAAAVPPDRFDDIALVVNTLPEVAHNYQRDHELNMWFVLATETPEGIAQAIHTIERVSGCRVYNFPKQREYYVGLRLAV